MRRTLATAAFVAAGALGMLPVTAAAECPELPTSQPFAPWGDDGLYTEVPGGLFEQTLSWDAIGSPSLVDDPFDHGDPGSTSVRLHGGDAITSPVLCVSSLYPHLRFLAVAADEKSHLVLEALWTDDKGKHKLDALSEEASKRYKSWAPSEQVQLRKVLPKDLDDVRDVQLRFSVREKTGEWLVDDVYVDPFKRG